MTQPPPAVGWSSIILARRMLKLTRQRPVTCHYANTIKKLGSDNGQVRIGDVKAALTV